MRDFFKQHDAWETDEFHVELNDCPNELKGAKFILDSVDDKGVYFKSGKLDIHISNNNLSGAQIKAKETYTLNDMFGLLDARYDILSVSYIEYPKRYNIGVIL